MKEYYGESIRTTLLEKFHWHEFIENSRKRLFLSDGGNRMTSKDEATMQMTHKPFFNVSRVCHRYIAKKLAIYD